jgi:hypothetical protein
MEFFSHVDYAPNHWPTNQPLFICLYARCFGLLGRESLQPVMQSEYQWKKPEPYAMEFNAASAEGCMFACHGTQPVSGEDREISLLLPSFSLLLL